jgi:hypothetical protein
MSAFQPGDKVLIVCGEAKEHRTFLQFDGKHATVQAANLFGSDRCSVKIADCKRDQSLPCSALRKLPDDTEIMGTMAPVQIKGPSNARDFHKKAVNTEVRSELIAEFGVAERKRVTTRTNARWDALRPADRVQYQTLADADRYCSCDYT